MTDKNFFITTLFILITALPFSSAEATPEKHSKDNHKLFGSHGMVLFKSDEQQIFASHLPLYFSPHNYQIIYQIELKNTLAIESLLAGNMVTLLPEKFDLTKLINGQYIELQSQIFDGHFERGGKAVSSTMVRFIKPVLVQKVASEKTSQQAKFYQVKINASQNLVIHKIDKAPSFDAIALQASPLHGSTIKTSPLNASTQSKTAEQPHNAIALCPKPELLDAQNLKQHLASCGLQKLLYLETKDFAK